MNFFSFARKPKKEVEIILDVGSKTVGGGIFEIDPTGGSRLLYTTREPISFQKILTGENLLLAMLRSLSLVMLHLEKYGLKHLSHVSNVNYQVSRVSAVLSSPWHISETKNIKSLSDEKVLVTEKFVEDLISKEENDFKKSLSNEGNLEEGISLLEHKIIEMRLNGYPSANPYCQKVSELELRIFTSISPKNVVEKIKSSVSKSFVGVEFEFHTFSLASFVSIRDLFPHYEDFMVINIGGEVTDIVVVKKSNIVFTVSLPLGHNNLLRSLHNICDNHATCTLEGLINLHKTNKGNEVDRKKVDLAIEESRSSWLELFSNAVSGFSTETFLPKTVFLFEDNPYALVFEDFLRSVESKRFTVTGESFEIITTDYLMNLPLGTKDFFSLDPILAIEASFALSTRKSCK